MGSGLHFDIFFRHVNTLAVPSPWRISWPSSRCRLAVSCHGVEINISSVYFVVSVATQVTANVLICNDICVEMGLWDTD